MKPRNTYWAVISQLPTEMASMCMSASRSAQEHRVQQLFVVEQLGCGPRELHLPALHVDRTIRDGQRDVDRLLDDHHRQAFGLQSFDDGEELLHDKRCETERELVDEQDVRFQ